jgi:hypothetical protein
MLGQPRPVRRTTSRMRRAPPPYMGAMTTRAASILMGRSPSRYSATSGAVKRRAMAAPMLRWNGAVWTATVAGATWDDMRLSLFEVQRHHPSLALDAPVPIVSGEI